MPYMTWEKWYEKMAEENWKMKLGQANEYESK